MSKAEFPYDLSDRAIELLLSKLAKRLSALKSRLSVLNFDEINSLRNISRFYADIDKDNQRAFLELAQQVYSRAEPHGNKKPDEDWLIEYILTFPCPATKYIYENETLRKRDRAIEAVNSTFGRNQKLNEITKHAKYWQAQTEYYSDYTADEALKKAYIDGGVNKVKWVTERDNKVCSECAALDGKIFDIKDVPDKPHVRCRCRIVPYIET